MKDNRELLEQAIDLAQEEYAHLQAGDLELLQQKARKRKQLVAQVVVEKGGGLDLDELKEKLEQLHSLQGRLTKDARTLRDDIKSELSKVKTEGKRMSGYGKACQYTPLLKSRFSKWG